MPKASCTFADGDGLLELPAIALRSNALVRRRDGDGAAGLRIVPDDRLTDPLGDEGGIGVPLKSKLVGLVERGADLAAQQRTL